MAFLGFGRVNRLRHQLQEATTLNQNSQPPYIQL